MKNLRAGVRSFVVAVCVVLVAANAICSTGCQAHKRSLNARDSQLLDAVSHGDVAAARIALDHGANPNALFPSEPSDRPMPRTVLLVAIERLDAPMAKLLLEHGADPQSDGQRYLYATMGGRTAAETADCVALMGLLLQYLPSGPTPDKNQALGEATFNDMLPFVRQLLKFGADPNSVDEVQRTPLQWAATKNDPTLVNVLIKAGANVNLPGMSPLPLVEAVQAADLDTTAALLKAGADIHADGDAALKAAAGGYSPAIAGFLMDHGADSSRVDGGSESPSPVPGNGQIRMGLASPRGMAGDFAHEEVLETIHAGKLRKTDLITAVRCADTEAVENLIENGANVNAADTTGDTPIVIAVGFNQTDIVALLLNHGANPNTRDSYGTPVLSLVWAHAIAILLIQHHADVNARARLYGDTPLITAAGRNNYRTMKVLLDAGADPRLKSSLGYSALTYSFTPEEQTLMKAALAKEPKT